MASSQDSATGASEKRLGGAAPLHPDEDLVRGGKDSAATRKALVRAARRRFATEGYRAATVRNIAADAGVNVALISRYFGSKEGLFEACVQRTVDELEPRVPGRPADLEETIGRVVRHVLQSPHADAPLQLLLLLRSSGDDNADDIRRRTLESFTQQLAAVAGWTEADPRSAHLLLRAQIALATMLGMVMMRTAALVQPMSSATADDLALPLGQVLRTLLDSAADTDRDSETHREH